MLMGIKLLDKGLKIDSKRNERFLKGYEKDNLINGYKENFAVTMYKRNKFLSKDQNQKKWNLKIS